MANTREVWAFFRRMEETLSERMGVYMPGAPRGARVRESASQAPVAVLTKALLDKGLLTEADLREAWRATRDDEVWVAEPDPPETPGAPPPERTDA